MKMQSEITTFQEFMIDFLGFIVTFAFHEIIKQPLINNSPAFFKRVVTKGESNCWLFFKIIF
jgi:hypothetical protein